MEKVDDLKSPLPGTGDVMAHANIKSKLPTAIDQSKVPTPTRSGQGLPVRRGDAAGRIGDATPPKPTSGKAHDVAAAPRTIRSRHRRPPPRDS